MQEDGPGTPDADDLEDENLHSLTTDDLSQRIRLQPTNPELYLVRGVRLYYLGRFQPAIADYSKAIELNPTYVLAFNNRGTAYMELGQFQMAQRDFTRVIQLTPESPVGYFNRALLYESHDKFDLAIDDLTSGVPFALDFSILYRRALIHETTEQFQNALDDYSQIIERAHDGDQNEAIFKRGMLLFRLRREEQARRDLLQVVQKLKYRRLASKALRKMDEDARRNEDRDSDDRPESEGSQQDES